MNLLRYLRNVATGRYRHWNTEHVPLVQTLHQRVRELPSFERAVLLSVVVASVLVVDQLLGPDAGKGKIMRADARQLTRREFFHIYFLLAAGFLAIFLSKADLSEHRAVLEGSFAHLFHHDPARDESYCKFSEKLKNSDHPSAAFLYLYSELSCLAGEPGPSEAKDLARPGLFVVAMGSGSKTMFELVQRELGGAS
ncbi:MAG TPA: hypothetical protein VH394_30365 [Thermoanaerobaculia bacterium]|jgi:hypothetical protein|nr:hypothetical protein [Thermoanaerobaculia bacterium]